MDDDEDDKTVTCEALVTLVVNLKRQSLSVELGKEDESSIAKSALTESENQADTNENNEDENRSKIEEVKAKSNHKPWEKQKKKSKTAKSKSKAKAKPVAKKATTSNTQSPKGAASEANEETNKLDNNESDPADKATTSKTQSPKGAASSAKEESEANGETDKLDNNESDAAEKDSAAEESVAEDSEAEETHKNSNKNNNNTQDDRYFEEFQKMQKKKEKLETKKKISHRVYCPFFPEIKQEFWWLYLANKKQNAILSPPVHVCSLKTTEEVSHLYIYKSRKFSFLPCNLRSFVK